MPPNSAFDWDDHRSPYKRNFAPPAIGQNEKLILASNSPRRKQLLAEAGWRFTVLPPDDEVEQQVAEQLGVGCDPAQLVQHLAWAKAQQVAGQVDRGLVLAADTVAALNSIILGKPADREDARRILTLLQGRTHEVHTGVCLWRRPDDRVLQSVVTTQLEMAPLSDSDIEEYLGTMQWVGKAGAFGFQEGPQWLRIIRGSPSNVVGLPMECLCEMLQELYPSQQQPPK